MKILVVDTDSERVLAFKVLESAGHLVQAVNNCSEALDFLERVVFQILVLGPRQTSEESINAIAEWRQSVAGKTVPGIVAMEPGTGTQGEGIDHYLSLPLQEEHIKTLVGLPFLSPEQEVFDNSAALEICDGDENLLGDIIKIFLQAGPGRIEKLTQGMKDNDWRMVREAAHLMKGSALNLAANALCTATSSLERAGEAGNPDHIRFWYEHAVYEYRRLENHLQGLLGCAPEVS
ncbi:MAG: response regulator [Nitrospinota bacterium]|nr:response regulator [Nitrospinota bacterium]